MTVAIASASACKSTAAQAWASITSTKISTGTASGRSAPLAASPQTRTTPKAALVYQHSAADRDQLIAERLSARMSDDTARE